jgi:hypothetical protein
MIRAPGNTVGDVIELLLNDHWEETDCRQPDDGTECHKFTHPIKPGIITIMGSTWEVMGPEATRSILTIAQLR